MAYVAIASVAVSAVGLAYQANQQEIVQRKQKEAANRQQAMQEIEAGKQRQAAVREARAQRAQLQSQAQGAGVEGSSGLGGATSSIASQLGSNLAFQNTQTQFNQSMSSLQSDINQAQGNMQMGQAVEGLVQSGLQGYGNYKKYNTPKSGG